MSKKVLIVEDYADMRRMMRILIHRLGYDVIEAEDGYDALGKTVKHHPDLILMDLAMPVLDGFTATKLIRNIKGCEEIPIVVLSAYGDNYYKKAVEAGCNEVINKPLHFDRIEPLLSQYL